MPTLSIRIGVPHVAVADSGGDVHRFSPTTGGVRFAYLYTKTDVQIEVSFKMLGDGKPLVPGQFYHLVVTMPPNHMGECEVRQCKEAKCGNIVTTYPDDPNSGAPTTEFSFTFPETLAESNMPWRDVLIYGHTEKPRRRRKSQALVESQTSGQDRPNNGEAPDPLA